MAAGIVKLDPIARKALGVFKGHGGILRTSDALEAGIHPRTLYALRDSGAVETLGRGLYRLASLPPLSNPDLVPVALKVPDGVLCLISALAFHDLTTQIPHEVYLAIQRGAAVPHLDHPPIQVYQFSGMAFSEGVETRQIDGISVRVYNPGKTLADCFKFRNKIGLDTVIEALRLYLRRRDRDIDRLIHYAAVCRVANVMRPYLEALL